MENHGTFHIQKLQLNCNEWRYHVYIAKYVQVIIGRSYLDDNPKNLFCLTSVGCVDVSVL